MRAGGGGLGAMASRAKKKMQVTQSYSPPVLHPCRHHPLLPQHSPTRCASRIHGTIATPAYNGPATSVVTSVTSPRVSVIKPEAEKTTMFSLASSFPPIPAKLVKKIQNICRDEGVAPGQYCAGGAARITPSLCQGQQHTPARDCFHTDMDECLCHIRCRSGTSAPS